MDRAARDDQELRARAMQFCADDAVQTLGGAGFIRGTRAERIYREAKVMRSAAAPTRS